MLLKITLKCLSLRVVLDLLNQVVNVDAMFGTPEILKSMFSSLIARLNLFALNNAMFRFSSGANCSFTVCAFELFHSSGCPDPS